MKNIICLLLTLSMILTIVACGDKKTNEAGKDNSTNVEKQESTDNKKSDEFEIIYELSKVTESFWNSKALQLFGKDYTNKEAFDIRYLDEIGLPEGKLMMKPMGFSFVIDGGKENFKITVDDNDFLIPRLLDVPYELGGISPDTLHLTVVSNKLTFARIELTVEDISKAKISDDTLELAWHVDRPESFYRSYMKLNDKYVLQIEYRMDTLDESKEKSDINDINELATRVNSIISVEKTDEEYTGNIKLNNDIELDSNISVNADDYTVVKFGAYDTYDAEGNDEYNLIGIKNKLGKQIFVYEYKSGIDLTEKYANDGSTIENFTYKGMNLFIRYLDVDGVKCYNHIEIKINDNWYIISPIGTVKTTETSIENYIETTFNGVITIK